MYRLPRLGKSLSIAKKDLKIYYGKGPVVIFGILLPFFFFFAFLVGRKMPPLSLIAGLSGMAIWFTSTSISPVVVPWETRTKTLERLVASPISVTEMLLGDIIGSITLATSISAVTIFAVAAILGLMPVNFLTLLLGIVLASFCFSAIGVLISALPTDTTSDIMMLSTLIKFPLIFVSGIFIPTSNLPGWGTMISRFSPLTYFVDLVRFSFSGSGSPWMDIGALFGFSLLFLFASDFFHRRTLLKRL
ncbi:ABC transporter permease [Candidatus Bipolaricaulota bacterium]|nr:ABC transporter permease [Candidatus Bipolaricaulota bacterium]